jgi:hypothetical protein
MITTFLAQVQPTANTVWFVTVAVGSFTANVATILTMIAMWRKQKAEVTFGFVPASKAEFDQAQRLNHQAHLEIFQEINRLKAENLQMTREIGKITNETLAALAHAHAATRK